eukprot:scaffold2533_cov137-Cylindrotheca_fusiformis.AAC.16
METFTESTYTHDDERFALTLIQSNGGRRIGRTCCTVTSVLGIVNGGGNGLINIRGVDNISYDRNKCHEP